MRVAVSAMVSDGTCFCCREGLFSLCDNTSPSGLMEKLFGHRTSGIFGYSNLTGSYPGGQAQFVRVPFADVNCLPLPDDVSDDQGVFLSDALCTAWHACELAGIGAGGATSVAIWGAGPIGLLTCACAKARTPSSPLPPSPPPWNFPSLLLRCVVKSENQPPT
eukprot:TRINITY_DN6158_c0_g2_i1.p1 TRINITY_DN6158_c0_g2~~TRINITY_DN6158_c0_g2_i1.p1  ORF type:complete len:163 (+),score=33.37 TRINITY_DN6158_c0_g2_i1:236-724(+)